MKINFIGYIAGKPMFELRDHSFLPDRTRMDCDELRAFNIPIPQGLPNYYEWVRGQFRRRLDNLKMLNSIGGEIEKRNHS